MKPVAIIGGGITGLTAAWQLRKLDIPFSLYESGRRLGGPIRTIREHGYLAEAGPNTLLETSDSIKRLVSDLGLETRRVYSDPMAANRYIAKHGRLVPVPDGIGSFISTALFSATAKVRLGLEPFIPPSSPESEESVADFVTRRLGREFLDYAINPMVGGIYAGDPKRLSVRHAFPKLLAVEQRYGSLLKGQFLGARERKKSGRVSKQNAPKFSFLHGLEELIDTLGKKLEESIKLAEPVVQLRPSEKGWSAITRRNGEVFSHEHSAVILAIPADALARLQIAQTIPNLQLLEEIYYPPVASVVLGFRRDEIDHPLDGFGVLVPEVEGMKILGTIFSSSLFPGRAPEGHVTLTSYLGGSRNPDLPTAHESKLVDSALGDLKTLLGLRGSPTYRYCSVFRHAIPQYNVGYGRFKALMAELESAAPGVFVGGHCRDGISLSDSIESGMTMADRAIAQLTSA
jgi:protoporphyrinogen/coproporphyrinogen III oxidase